MSLIINTNTSSIIAQKSLKGSTTKLNLAVERMTTGCKINHAKDNAANYSIATNMITKMNSYMVAQDNVAIGMEMVGTAESVISQMHDHVIRLRELATQARNNTYGADSLQAIQSEANARIAEIARLYSSSEFNGISLFEDVNGADASPAVATFVMSRSTTSESKFIEEIEQRDTTSMVTMTQFVNGTTSATNEYSISTKEELVALANYVNSGKNTSGLTFILGADIDLSSISNWTPIGDYSTNTNYIFKGTFDGNGHVIKNLTINRSVDYQGLFGWVNGSIKNIGLEGGSVIGNSRTGSLVGRMNANSIDNCYSTCDVTASGAYIGGLAGVAYADINNCYATGDVTGNECVGGLVGYTECNITTSYATSNVKCYTSRAGGLAGYANHNITHCYATGKVEGNDSVGGLVGQFQREDGIADINSCYFTGDVTGIIRVGSLLGNVQNSYKNTTFGTVNVINCYSLDKGTDVIGACSIGPDKTEHTYGKDSILAGITVVDDIKDIPLIPPTLSPPINNDTNRTGGVELQVGIHEDSNSRISFNTYFQYDLSEVGLDIGSDASLSAIDDFIDVLSAKETELGAVTNRLESVLDEIEIQYNNLASSRSTIRDADIAEVSSQYIQQQILQQASSTLLATANQTPSIALQLI